MLKFSGSTVVSTLAILVTGFGAALAQTYPDRPLKLVVPYAAGGLFDAQGRLLANSLHANLGQPVIVDNRPGGGATVGTEYVAKSKNDGYTLLMAGATTFAIAPHAYKNLRYRIEDFQTVSLTSLSPLALVVNPEVLRVKDFGEFVAYAKANPGKIQYATSGRGVVTHLLGELIASQLSLDMAPVHYKGEGPALQDLLGGHVTAMISGLAPIVPQMRAGKVTVLGITMDKRLPSLPDAPTFAERGYSGLAVPAWVGIVVPKGTPVPIVARLHKAVVDAVASEEVKNKILADASLPATSTPEEFDAFIRKDSAVWGALVKKLEIVFD